MTNLVNGNNSSNNLDALVDALSEIGDGTAKVTGSQKTDPSVKFMVKCEDDIAALARDPNVIEGHFFLARKVGGYAITFRSGIKKMVLRPGKEVWNVGDAAKAIELLTYAKNACEKGELDAVFAKLAERKLAD